jgi:hypothetical protein
MDVSREIVVQIERVGETSSFVRHFNELRAPSFRQLTERYL